MAKIGHPVYQNTNVAESGTCGRTATHSATSHAVSEHLRDQHSLSLNPGAESTTRPRIPDLHH